MSTVDVFWAEDKIFLTGEKQQHFELFLRREVGESIRLPDYGWTVADFLTAQEQSRIHQIIEFVLSIAREQDLDFTGNLLMTKDDKGKLILKGENIVFLKQDVSGGNGVR